MRADITARANVNVALAKYWGKRDATLNLPAVGSISVTLDGLGVVATVRALDAGADRLVIDGREASGEERRRLAAFLDLVRERAGRSRPLAVATESGVPPAAGLASSAAAFAAVALASSRALGAELAPRELSVLARRGSGSAARSVFGGFVEWHRGERPDGADSFAEPLLGREAWDLAIVVALVSRARKATSSRDGMLRAATSPYYPAWVAGAEGDLAAARAAIAARDLDALGRLAERSALKMHAVGLGAEPPLLYWRGATVACMHRVWALRTEGTAAYFTVDAGPQVKVLCERAAAETVRAALAAVPGVEEVLVCAVGGGAEVVA